MNRQSVGPKSIKDGIHLKMIGTDFYAFRIEKILKSTKETENKFHTLYCLDGDFQYFIPEELLVEYGVKEGYYIVFAKTPYFNSSEFALVATFINSFAYHTLFQEKKEDQKLSFGEMMYEPATSFDGAKNKPWFEIDAETIKPWNEYQEAMDKIYKETGNIFINPNTQKQMDFGAVFSHVKDTAYIKSNGKEIFPEHNKSGFRRKNWEPNVVVRVQTPDAHSKMTGPYLYLEADLGRLPWQPSTFDLFANNWELVD